MMSRLSGSPTTFDQLRPRLAVWMHFRDALRRCGRILGTAMRKKEYSLKDVILILGRNKECGDTDIADQVCLAYGHAVLHGIHLLDGYGIAEVDNVYPLVSPGYSIIPNEEVVQIRSLLANEHRDTLQWFSFPREMIQFQTASAQSAIDLGGVNVVYYNRLMEQISEYGNILSNEVDVSHGVNRKFHKCDPIDAFPMLDSDLDLSDDAIGSQFVKKIFPSFQEQMVAKHIRKFMSPDTSSREALPLVKKFLKDNPQGSTTSTGAMGGGQPTVTEKFYTFWQDEFPDVQSTPAPPHDVPSAPQAPSASTTTHTTMRSATVMIEETVFSMKPLTCILHTRAAATSSKKSVTRNLEVKVERDIVRNGVAGDITYMIDKDTNAPFRGEVEQVQCDRLAMPRYAMYIRNLTLASMLANPSKEMLLTTRDVVLSDCGIRKIVDTYEVAMNAASLQGTSRGFPPEVVAWAMIGVDEADVLRALPMVALTKQSRH